MRSQNSSVTMPDDEAAIDALLRVIKQHDLKREAAITETMRIRAEARLEQILATPTPVEHQAVRRPAPVGFAATKLAWAGRRVSGLFRPRSSAVSGFRLAAIAVLSIVVIAITTLLPAGTGVQPAFASWTPNPTPVSPSVLELADAVCLQGINRSLRNLNASQIGNSLTELAAPPTVAEQRGDWVLFSYAEGGQSAGCLLQVIAGQPRMRSSWANSEAGGSLMTTSQPGESLEFGNSGASSSVGGREFEFGNSGAFSVVNIDADNGIYSFNMLQVAVPNAGPIRVFSAQVNDDVTALSIDAGPDGQIVATVTQGTALAWWPSAPELELGISGIILTYDDGRIVEVPMAITQFGSRN